MKKDKIIKTKLFSLILASVTAFGAVACNSADTSYTGLDKTGLSNGAVETENGNKVTQTSQIMVENGNTEYVIVVPSQPSVWDNTALEELCGFLLSSTGADFVSVSDEGLTFDENKKYSLDRQGVEL